MPHASIRWRAGAPAAAASLLLCALAARQPAATAGGQATPPPLDVSITVDAAETRGPLEPIYRFFGADEPNYTYMEDGRRLLGYIGALGRPQAYFRSHSLMVTGDGTPALKWGSTNMYTEDAEGRPVYDWTIVDRIFDALLENGVKPYVQIGFMPKALSTRPDPYRHAWKPGDRFLYALEAFRLA